MVEQSLTDLESVNKQVLTFNVGFHSLSATETVARGGKAFMLTQNKKTKRSKLLIAHKVWCQLIKKKNFHFTFYKEKSFS